MTDDQGSNYFTDTDDHRKIDGAEVHKVIFRKETAYEFTLSGDDCGQLSNPERGLSTSFTRPLIRPSRIPGIVSLASRIWTMMSLQASW